MIHSLELFLGEARIKSLSFGDTWLLLTSILLIQRKTFNRNNASSEHSFEDVFNSIDDIITQRMKNLLLDISDTSKYQTLSNIDNGFSNEYVHPRFIAQLLIIGQLLDFEFYIEKDKIEYAYEDEADMHHYKSVYGIIDSYLITPSIIKISATISTKMEFSVLRKWLDNLRTAIEEFDKAWSNIAPEGMIKTVFRIERPIIISNNLDKEIVDNWLRTFEGNTPEYKYDRRDTKTKQQPMRVFISYSHHDKEIAQLFYKYFTAQGFDVLWDGNITFGSKLKELNEMILDCDAFVVIISEHSIESRYVQSEISLALGYMGTHGKPIIPYIKERSNKYIPSDLLQYQCYMGTERFDRDAIELTNALEKIQGTMLAKKEESKKVLEAEREQASEKVEVVKRNLVEYTEEVFKRLEKNEKRDRLFAFILYALSVLFLVAAVLFSIIKIHLGAETPAVFKTIENVIANILTLAIIVALSRLSFTLAKAFMTNALKSGDRIHAISFGKFFIQAYGEEATREEVRTVFGEWNIDKGTSFHSQNTSDYDPNILSALEVIKSALTKKT